ncbi:uncharacterized protein LOC126899252 [Daktulosphaira vitifoliae]|uniref:uncharacterized protein LOC126899252 n=1 Tax=Daktulosphaira vitifoliae TaxID=58002 RepID=UPI0021AAFD52|nr:uncharacterized protein LOC126899252 [Daktulosphaira vitifoliae]XP_050529897.1 uncharacterized protein LOC126899252 [Daktulosphaira vitifoliae]XP_050529898.1 uncharacterized protein LOC126899252 [Daktulosphaira vitifoliae]XP_050529899.1 uncharacterized protein LOC126899252 [Daktulosphaira vitifoliae]
MNDVCDHRKKINDAVQTAGAESDFGGGERVRTSRNADVAYQYVACTAILFGSLVLAAYLVGGYASRRNALETVRLLRNPAPVRVVNASTRDFCAVISKELFSLERMGYVDPDRRVSRLAALDATADDVHYVIMNTTFVPWLLPCSLESALAAVGSNGRVNVFLVYGVRVVHRHPQRRSVSLSESLEILSAGYGNRLNVHNVSLEECLECSPFREENVRRPDMAKFMVELVLLWQFGGTILDPGVVTVQRNIRRVSRGAVEFDDHVIRSPTACHGFVYSAMLCAKSFALSAADQPFERKTRRRILDKTVEVYRYSARDARPLEEGVVCKNGVVANFCCYVEADRIADYEKSYVHGFCPATGDIPFFRPDQLVVT